MTQAITVSELLSAYHTDRASIVADGGRTIRYKALRIARQMGNLPIDYVTQAVVDSYISERTSGGASVSTARAEMAILCTACNWIGSPVRVRTPRILHSRIRVLTADEIAALLAAARPTLKTFIQIAISTAARKTAICELTWDRVNFQDGTIDLRAPHPRAERRKKRAVVPISPILHDILKARKNLSRDNRVIGTDSGSLGKSFLLARKRAGFGPDVTSHVLRHTAATHMIRSGVPIIEVSRMLGHASVRITEEVYIHLCPNDLRRAADALSSLL